MDRTRQRDDDHVHAARPGRVAHRGPYSSDARACAVPEPRGAGGIRHLTGPLSCVPGDGVLISGRRLRRREPMTTTPMTEPDLMPAITAERQDLADLLGDLPAGAWDAPTLCDGWRVRELVAHLTMPFRYSGVRFLAELARS